MPKYNAKPSSLASLQRSDLSSQLRTARGTKTSRLLGTPCYPRVELKLCDGYIELLDVLLAGGNRRKSATIIGPAQDTSAMPTSKPIASIATASRTNDELRTPASAASMVWRP